jgi:molybdenum cofactor synthesis domain-containing protein
MSEREFIPVGIAVITISDTRVMADDKSGQTLVDRIVEAGHRLAGRSIVKDDVRAIRACVRKLAKDKSVDVIISTGGTGLTGRDVTVEAMQPLFDKEIEGFGVLSENRHFHCAVARHRWRCVGQICVLPARFPRGLPRWLGRDFGASAGLSA